MRALAQLAASARPAQVLQLMQQLQVNQERHVPQAHAEPQ
jgi:hypothetical protein